MGVKAHKLAVPIAVTVAGSGAARLDVAQHWTCVTADRVVSHAGYLSASPGLPLARGLESPVLYESEFQPHHGAHSGLPAPWESQPVHRFPLPRMVRPATDLPPGSIPPAEYLRRKESGSHEDSRLCRG